MSNMFSGANYSLPETLDLRAFNTSNVTTMRSMFDNCVSEEILGLDNFNTANVTDMAFMFNASKATELDLSSFNTSHVTDMENMFCNCDVRDLDISNFDTSSVPNMSCMFENVQAPINVSSFDTSNVTNMHNMFKGTSGTTLDLSNFNTSSVTDMSGMFMNAEYEEIDTSSFDTSEVTTMNSMFYGSSVEELDLSNFDFSNVIDMGHMFQDCNLNLLIFPNNFDASNVTNIDSLFRGLTIPTLDLRGIDFPAAKNRQFLFGYINANTLDLSDWDLGAGVSTVVEFLFYHSTIHNLKLSNNNYFPEGYSVAHMFGYFKTDGILDLSNFIFNKAINPNTYAMFEKSSINTLIMGNITSNEFASSISYPFFNQTSVELLDMSASLIEIEGGNYFFNGIVATRINMPNQICVETSEYGSISNSSGKVKYVDYSSVNTVNADYTSRQWEYMSKYTTRYNKIVWIPSTFILDGNHTMYLYSGEDVYTDALNYTDLGWNSEPSNVTMHYGTTHADFEQAILDDDSDEWVSPLEYPLFYCYTSVPLNTPMKKAQFESDNYDTVYYDDQLIESVDNFIFTEIGTHTLKIIVNDYAYKQKVKVVDHGSNYSIVGTPKDYSWNSSTKRYTSTTSDKIQCRLYPDKYLFLYTDKRMVASTGQYTCIEEAPDTTITKISGAPFYINRLCLSGCTQLRDISELIIMNRNSSRGFDPSAMFMGCTNLSDVSVVDKWSISTRYSYLYDSGYTNPSTSWKDYNYSSTFSNTHITSAPRISITPSSSTFYKCTYLTDISKLLNFSAGSGYSSGSGYSFNSIFSGCSNLSNVSRLKSALSSIGSGYNINLGSFLAGTAITNTDFIPDSGINVITIDNIFSGCSSLTDLSGMSRVKFHGYANFYNAFLNIPATDYSPLSNWDYKFSSISFSTCKMSDLSFMHEWDLSNCKTITFYGCPNLTSVSDLSGKLTAQDVNLDLSNCTSLTSLVGLEECNFGTDTKFQNCSALTSLNGLQGCTIKNGVGLFSGCTSLSDITALLQVTFSDITNINSMFNGCKSLTNLNGLQELDISNVNQLVGVFWGCTALSNLDAIAGWNPYQVRNINNLFTNCSSITSFAAIHNWTTGQLTSMNNAFSGCSALTSLDGLVGFNPGQCTSLSYLFSNCSALTDISDITYWYVGRCTNMTYMFSGCTSLSSVDPIKNWNIAKLTNMTRMFSGDVSIADAEVLNNWSNIKNMSNVTRSYAFYQVPTPWPTWA